MAQRHKQSLASDEDIVTVIAHELRIVGRIHGQEDIRVRGTIEGSVMLSGGALHIEKTGVVLADVQAESVFVSGIVVGDLTAQDRVVLSAGARVVGDISTQRLVIEPGAAVRGNIATADAPVAVEREQRAAVEIPQKTAIASPADARKAAAATSSAIEIVEPSAQAPKRRAKKATTETKRAVRATSSSSRSPSSRSGKQKKAPKKKSVAPRMPARGKHRVARS